MYQCPFSVPCAQQRGEEKKEAEFWGGRERSIIQIFGIPDSIMLCSIVVDERWGERERGRERKRERGRK